MVDVCGVMLIIPCEPSCTELVLCWDSSTHTGGLFEGLVEDSRKDFWMERVFKGRKTETDRIVEVEQNGSVALLPLEPSLEIANHSPDGFNWGYNGSGTTQLALGILYEVTGDAELARNYYQFFKSDHVSRWGEVWEMSESEVRRWLRDVGAGNV